MVTMDSSLTMGMLDQELIICIRKEAVSASSIYMHTISDEVRSELADESDLVQDFYH